MIFLFLEKPFKKKDTDLRTFIFFLMAAAHRQARDANSFLSSSTTHRTFYYRITIVFHYCHVSRTPCDGNREKNKTVNTTNLRQPRRLLTLNLLKTCPSFSAFPHFCALFFFSLQVKSCYSDSGLFLCGL